MRREDIPARLRVARPADCRRIPQAALKSMKPADVAPRLSAADEFRRRARVPHLDGDLMSYRLGLASEVLTTADPKRAAALIKAAGITPGQRPAAPSQAAGKSAAACGPLAKSAPRSRERSVTVPTPALDIVSGSPSFHDGMTTLIRHGLLHQGAREMGQVAAVHADLNGAGHVAKAERYKSKAMAATDPADRRGYEQLAKAELEKAGLA